VKSVSEEGVGGMVHGI